MDLTRLSSTSHNLRQQPLRLPLQGQDVGPYLLQRAERLRLVEVAGEADMARVVSSGYLFSVSRPDRYLWMTLDSSVW